MANELINWIKNSGLFSLRSSLSNNFSLVIKAFITMNYDNLITQACPMLFTGFNENTGLFDAARKRKGPSLFYKI